METSDVENDLFQAVRDVWRRLRPDDRELAQEMLEATGSTVEDVQAVWVEGDSVIYSPKDMTTGKFYFVEFKGEVQLYRKINDHQVEIYELELA